MKKKVNRDTYTSPIKRVTGKFPVAVFVAVVAQHYTILHFV